MIYFCINNAHGPTRPWPDQSYIACYGPAVYIYNIFDSFGKLQQTKKIHELHSSGIRLKNTKQTPGKSTNRKQQMTIHRIHSAQIIIDAGNPQGTVHDNYVLSSFL